jgi:outer membrane protein OmpA-like peptidoglycan-associated protein
MIFLYLSYQNILTMKRTFTILVVAILAVSTLSAQNADRRIGLGVHFGKNEYSGDLGNGFFDWSQPFYGFLGVSLYAYLNPSFDIGFSGSRGDYGYSLDAQNSMFGRKTDASFRLVYKLNNGYILSETSRFAPSIFAGVGGATYRNPEERSRKINHGVDVILPVGFNLKYIFTDWLALRYQLTGNFTFEDKRDYIVEEMNDFYWQHSLGLVFSIGKKEAAAVAPVVIAPAVPTPQPQPEPKPEPVVEVVPEPEPEPEPEQIVVEEPVKLEVIEKDYTGTIENVLFAFDSFEIRQAYIPILENVVRVMRDFPQYKLEITGHTDNIGTPAYNQELSRKRADAVMSYLVNKGVQAGRMSVIYKGETMPEAGNDTPENRTLNRRVEFRLVK